MPYPINDGAFAQLALMGRVNGQRVMNVFHYRFNGSSITDGEARLGVLIDAWDAPLGIAANFLEMLADSYLLETIRAQWILPIRYRYTDNGAFNQNGTIVADLLPQNTQATIEWRPDVGGSRVNGGTRVGGLPVTANLGGLWTGASRTASDIFAASFILPVTLAEGELVPVVFNRLAPATSRVITDWVIKDSLRVLRRRTVGLGE